MSIKISQLPEASSQVSPSEEVLVEDQSLPVGGQDEKQNVQALINDAVSAALAAVAALSTNFNVPAQFSAALMSETTRAEAAESAINALATAALPASAVGNSVAPLVNGGVPSGNLKAANVAFALNQNPQDLSVQLFKPGTHSSLIPLAAPESRRLHIDDYAQLQNETSYDGALSRLISDLPALGGKILIGAKTYLFLNTITLPVGVTIEGDGGHVGQTYLSASFSPIGIRPYTLLLTPGASLGAGHNPNLRAGALTLNDGCCVRNLNVTSAPVAQAVGNSVASVCKSQLAFNICQQVTGGIGIASLGNDTKVENVTISGFNIALFHDNGISATSGSGARPNFEDVRSTHNWIGFWFRNIPDGGKFVNLHHFPGGLAPTTNSSPTNAWSVTIASDGANGSDLTITAGPTITGQVDGAIVTILTQAANPSGQGTPAPSNANNNLNRFGDNSTNSPTPTTQPAVWRLRAGGVWVINLPTCPPSSFSSPPATISFEAVAGTGMGIYHDTAGATPYIGCGMVRAQLQYYIVDSQKTNFTDCVADSNPTIADMTSKGVSLIGTSYGCVFSGGYTNCAFEAIHQNITVTSGGSNYNNPSAKIIGRDLGNVPFGGSVANKLGGGLLLQSCSIQNGNFNVDTQSEILTVSGCDFHGNMPMTINGQSTATPAGFMLTDDNINAPPWIAVSSSFAPLVTTMTSGSTITVASSTSIVIVRKTSSSATIVVLPAAPLVGKTYTVKDGGGNANSYPITVMPNSSTTTNFGATVTIDGSASVVMSVNYQVVSLMFDGTNWNVLSPLPTMTDFS